MRKGMAWLIGCLAVGAAGFAVFSWSQGQEQPQSASPPLPISTPVSPSAETAGSKELWDLSKLPPLQRQMFLSARRGAEWLCRANRENGQFVYGYVPDLKTELEGDHYLRQAGAAVALARAARFSGDDHQAAIARQALLTLLLDTAPDPQHPKVRYTTLPSAIVNRLGAAGLLVLAINELPAPEADLLQQSEELCGYIAQQQRSDGSLALTEGDPAEITDLEGINYYPGEALYGLMLSHRKQPAAWKTDLVRKALAYYQPWWRSHKNLGAVPWLTAAYAEAYVVTKDKAYADAVYEMTDWVCGLQYNLLDPRHPLWVGGFMTWEEGKAVASAPQAGSASAAEGLAEAFRVARLAGDLPRTQHYRETLERCLQFLATLQYTDANTQHFAPWYRPVLVGGFYASHQDGTLRIDYTQHAVCALVQYLSYVRNQESGVGSQ